MKKIYRIIERIAKTDAKVLIKGESGTGKEIIANIIHCLGRENKPFIKINCSAIPDNLLESELFGYEKGAFSGALTTKKGKLEIAHQGTLLLDEIGDMSILAQSKVLLKIHNTL